MYPLSSKAKVALILLITVARIGALDDFLGEGSPADTRELCYA